MNREVGLALIPCPILLPSLISHNKVSVDEKHHKRKYRRSELRQALCEQGAGPGCRSLSHSSTGPSNQTDPVDVNHHKRRRHSIRTQELCEQGGGPGSRFLSHSPHHTHQFPISRMVSVDVIQHRKRRRHRRSELRSSRVCRDKDNTCGSPRQ